MSKTIHLDPHLRQQIATTMPEALSRAWLSYKDFVALHNPSKVKDFNEFHTASRIALKHVESLLALSAVAGLPGEDRELAKLMAEAMREVKLLERTGNV